MNSSVEKWFRLSIWKLNVDSITVFKSTSEFCFVFFFAKSRVRASSEVQTYTNGHMYANLLPEISATDLSQVA